METNMAAAAHFNFDSLVKVYEEKYHAQLLTFESESYEEKKRITDFKFEEYDQIRKKWSDEIKNTEQEYLNYSQYLNSILSLYHEKTPCDFSKDSCSSFFDTVSILFLRASTKEEVIEFNFIDNPTQIQLVYGINNITYKKPDLDNKVTIRVWSTDAIRSSVGHTSLETYGTNAIYASFWPTHTATDASMVTRAIHTVREICPSGVKSDFSCSVEEDIQREEGRKPNYEIDLYSLDKMRIIAAFNEISKKEPNWTLFPSLSSGASLNCCGLVNLLLTEGGAYNIIGTTCQDFLHNKDLEAETHIYDRIKYIPPIVGISVHAGYKAKKIFQSTTLTPANITDIVLAINDKELNILEEIVVFVKNEATKRYKLFAINQKEQLAALDHEIEQLRNDCNNRYEEQKKLIVNEFCATFPTISNTITTCFIDLYKNLLELYNLVHSKNTSLSMKNFKIKFCRFFDKIISDNNEAFDSIKSYFTLTLHSAIIKTQLIGEAKDFSDFYLLEALDKIETKYNQLKNSHPQTSKP
jgi:hypothetical protein